MMDTRERSLRSLLLALPILLVLASGSFAQAPLSPQTLALLDFYFSNLTTNSVYGFMIQDGAVTLVKLDVADVATMFATNTPVYTEGDPVAMAAGFLTPAGHAAIDSIHDAADVNAVEADPAFTAWNTAPSGSFRIECGTATNDYWMNDGRVTGVYHVAPAPPGWIFP